MITQMNIPQTILTVFYAIIWGGLANALPRWRAFDSGQFCDKTEGARARGRFFLGLSFTESPANRLSCVGAWDRIGRGVECRQLGIQFNDKNILGGVALSCAPRLLQALVRNHAGQCGEVLW